MAFVLATDELCTNDDVRERMRDVGIAAVSQDEDEQEALITRKRAQARKQLILDLKARLAVYMQPLGEYPGGVLSTIETPEDLLATLTNKEVLNELAVIYTVCALLEEGEGRLRFQYEQASDAISRMLDRWEKKKREKFENTFRLLTFDINGDGSISTFERLFSNRVSSIRFIV
jgi:hypothetical protein